LSNDYFIALEICISQAVRGSRPSRRGTMLIFVITALQDDVFDPFAGELLAFGFVII
jgi:hypothetical protein